MTFDATPLLGLSPSCSCSLQPDRPSHNRLTHFEARVKRRLWEVHTTQRYRTAGDFRDRHGSLGYESMLGVTGSSFLPGTGLLRAGVDYAHTRFAFASDTRLGAAGSEPFRHVQEVRLSAQLLTPLSKTWSSQLFGAVINAFESGAALDDVLSGIAGLGVMYRSSERLSIGLGALLLRPLGNREIIVVPIALVNWQVTDRLTLRSREDITLTLPA